MSADQVTTRGDGAMLTPEEEVAFEKATGPLRGELIAHCYRMLGSANEAEDLVQETYLRAWRAFHSFEGRSSVRTWMYSIATNSCLTALRQQSRRPLPSGLGQPPGDPHEPVQEDRSIPWLEPLPDRLVFGQGSASQDPADAVVCTEGVQLAVAAALQDLPPRQRAVLVLREVLQLSAAETARVLECTVASANSALQRARATIGDGLPEAGRRVSELSEREREVFAELCDAFERYDVPAVVGVMTEQATWQMPPFDRFYVGRADIAALIGTQCPASGPADFRILPIFCNGQPSMAMYLRDHDHDHDHDHDQDQDQDVIYRAFQVCVVDVAQDQVQGVVGFFDPAVFAQAGLPEVLVGSGAPPA
ncbi:sigma-70 family RNA polymerase sigma factor [Ornithinimicrobium sp. Y1847]|uniref:sigma-70 family RNA polymerase sigma factor n=1 Tax=Ornithinimicrobium sp. Y1847 TaxID=3405419 RepID=UPI003B66D9B6